MASKKKTTTKKKVATRKADASKTKKAVKKVKVKAVAKPGAKKSAKAASATKKKGLGMIKKAAKKAAAKKAAAKKVEVKKAAKKPTKKAAAKAAAPAEAPKKGKGGKAEEQGKDAQKNRLRSQPVEVQEIDVQVQRKRRSRLTEFQPRSYGTKPKKSKPSEVLDGLAKYMGKAPPISDAQQPGTVAEIGIFCIFALGGNSARVSLDATKRLVTEFPEWNEFRVSEAYEFLEVLEDVKLVEPYDRCEQVLEFINEVYQDQNAVDLEFLREMTAEDRLVALNRYRSLGPALSHYMALALQGFDGILFHYSWARVMQRVGLIPRSGSPKANVAATNKVFDKLDTVSLQINMIDLGEAICLPKNPNCRNCYLVMSCKSRKV